MPTWEKEKMRIWMQNRRAVRAELGLCIGCGMRPRSSTSKTCTDCRDKTRKLVSKWSNDNKPRRAAAATVRRAVRSGVITKSSDCQACGSTGKIVGHHNDYSKPLEVEWLCASCHRLLHSKTG